MPGTGTTKQAVRRGGLLFYVAAGADGRCLPPPKKKDHPLLADGPGKLGWPPVGGEDACLA